MANKDEYFKKYSASYIKRKENSDVLSFSQFFC